MTSAATSIARRVSLTVVAATGLVAASLPAHAALLSLPVTDTVHVVECDTISGTLANLQVLAVDTTSALLTPSGAGAPTSAGCSYDATTDPSTGISYIIASDDTLWSFDPVTTTSTRIGAFRLVSDPTDTRQLVAIAVDPLGNAFGIESTAQLHALDLETAEISPIGQNIGPQPPINALAAHPVTGKLYAVTYSGELGLWTYDTLTGQLELVTSVSQAGIYSIGFDSSGMLWAINYENNSPTLGVVDIENWATSYTTVGALRLASNPTYNFYTEALFVTSSDWPEYAEPEAPIIDDEADPELAATGIDTELGAGFLALALGSLIAGGLVLGARGRQRATH